ncbi:hypothetical protein [Arthrobacter rhombi]|uniref:hypothetical protein n=1 Tax=Arthrobacter rhombi TaxID=71253 RepID=UPI003FD13229
MSASISEPGIRLPAESQLRPAREVMDPDDMGGARATRHSFIRTMIRRATAKGWKIKRTHFDIDPAGCGTAVYRVRAESRVFSFAIFSQNTGEHTDRVIAKAWDITAALVEGTIDEERLARLQGQVPLQERGRAEPGSIIWTRANRSERFFEYVADGLANGRHPDSARFSGSPYVIRSTAFYSNGKCGLADYEHLTDDHPFAAPYRAHMLSAWLLREFSYDLVEAVAAHRNPEAATLTGSWRHYLGMGNATGLGMVPYAINHPEVLNAWAELRELPLAAVTGRTTETDDAEVARVLELFDRAMDYLAEQDLGVSQPYLPGPELADRVRPLLADLRDWSSTGSFRGTATNRIWQALHDAAAATGPEERGLVATILTELTADLDDDVEARLRCDESRPLTPGMTCLELAQLIDSEYAWVADHDFADPQQNRFFWFSSADNEEPRRGRRGQDPGENVQHGVDIARAVSDLRRDLLAAEAETSIAEFLLSHPWHRQSTARIQNIGPLPYGEVHDNLRGAEFLPLNVQRYQLSVYGMENYTPQSTDWLRVTLLSGGPRIADLKDGSITDDWLFTQRPTAEVQA